MRRAGWYLVHCGIESGSDRILGLMKKGTDTALILDRIRLLKRCGLPVAGYFILGVPGETREDIETTIRFARTSGLAWAHFASFLPIPGSEAGDAYLATHRRSGEGWEFFHNTACPAPPDGMSRDEMKRFQRRAFLSFYMRPGPVIRMLGLLRHRGSASRLLGRIAAYLSPGRIGRRGVARSDRRSQGLTGNPRP
jgi:radical SAM superfamily enzyme YgiQ (UPF0313 family)